MPPSATDLLKRTEVFGRLADRELRRLEKLFRERRVQRNQLLFQQGDPADSLYLVVSGRIRISAADQAGHHKVLAFAGPGEVVGEMGVLSGEPRSATALATDDAQLLQLRKSDLDVLLATDLELMRDLARVIARRREATQQRALDEAFVGEGYR